MNPKEGKISNRREEEEEKKREKYSNIDIILF
jgi:hypothetical protein